MSFIRESHPDYIKAFLQGEIRGFEEGGEVGGIESLIEVKDPAPDKGGEFASVKGRYAAPGPAKVQRVTMTAREKKFYGRLVILFFLSLGTVAFFLLRPTASLPARTVLAAIAQSKCAAYGKALPSSSILTVALSDATASVERDELREWYRSKGRDSSLFFTLSGSAQSRKDKISSDVLNDSELLALISCLSSKKAGRVLLLSSTSLRPELEEMEDAVEKHPSAQIVFSFSSPTSAALVSPDLVLWASSAPQLSDEGLSAESLSKLFEEGMSGLAAAGKAAAILASSTFHSIAGCSAFSTVSSGCPMLAEAIKQQ